MDKFQVVVSAGARSRRARGKDGFDRELAKAVHDGLPALGLVSSDTVVMKAALYLLEQGLLNVPGVGAINVKQARAFLWNAAWLQDYMNDEWRQQGLLSDVGSRGRKFQDFAVIIVGPGGTGKTAVLKITEALAAFFIDGDAVKKLAPSNAAARLLGGDTLHSLRKLPFGNARLTSKKGRLGATKLRSHRKLREDTVAAYMDEVSMISSDQLLQCATDLSITIFRGCLEREPRA